MTGLRDDGTAIIGAALRETGVMKGTTEGAEREGDNDKKDIEGVVPKTGMPVCEGLDLAPAAPNRPDAEGTEM